MIVKLGEPINGAEFARRTATVKAIRIMKEFLFETDRGWVQGYGGQWLIEDCERARHACDHEVFVRIYQPADRRKEPRSHE